MLPLLVDALLLADALPLPAGLGTRSPFWRRSLSPGGGERPFVCCSFTADSTSSEQHSSEQHSSEQHSSEQSVSSQQSAAQQ